VFDTPRESGLWTTPRVNRPALRSLLYSLALVLLFGLTGSGRASAAGSPSDLAASSTSASQVAVADLDGDLRPDSARIQSGLGIGGMRIYWIQVHVAAGRQSFPLVAPAFGLTIKARHVSGRNAADLVLATLWSRQPVAVFHNDGHGNFSQAEPPSSGSFYDSRENLDSSANDAEIAAGFPPQSGTGICTGAKESSSDQAPAGLIPPSSPGFPVSPFSVSHSGRAPPFAVALLT
jgi:hypothetical protein